MSKCDCTAWCGKMILADKSVKELLDLILGLLGFIRSAVEKPNFAPVHVGSQCRVWDWDPHPVPLFPLDNVYRLKSTRKGRKKTFYEAHKNVLWITECCQETRFQSPTFKTDDPAVYGTCSCSEAALVLTAGGRWLGIRRGISVSSKAFGLVLPSTTL